MPATVDHSNQPAGLRWWNSLGRGLDRLGDYAAVSSTVILLFMVGLIGLEIAVRTLFNSSTNIAEEYSGYLFTWVTLSCFLYAQRHDRYLRIVFVRDRLPIRTRLVSDCISSLAAAAMAGVLAYATWATFSTSLEFGSTSIQYSQTPLAIPQFIMPAGFVFLAIGFLQSAIDSLLQACGKRPIVSEKTNDLDVSI